MKIVQINYLKVKFNSEFFSKEKLDLNHLSFILHKYTCLYFSSTTSTNNSSCERKNDFFFWKIFIKSLDVDRRRPLDKITMDAVKLFLITVLSIFILEGYPFAIENSSKEGKIIIMQNIHINHHYFLPKSDQQPSKPINASQNFYRIGFANNRFQLFKRRRTKPPKPITTTVAPATLADVNTVVNALQTELTNLNTQILSGQPQIKSFYDNVQSLSVAIVELRGLLA